MSIITRPGIYESGSPFVPRVSKLKPNDPPSFYVRFLIPAEAMAHPEMKAIEQQIADLGKQHWGVQEFTTLLQNSQIRMPIRRDIAGKNWPANIVAFINAKSGADYPPAVVGPDALPIMDRAQIYPGCIVRLSLRIYAYGGRGTQFGAGISLGLENMQKLKDGERLKTARGDGSEFSQVQWEDNELSDLLA